ncbi:MerR family transcriptional regulator [Ornithinimicrobium pratense]|uniref:MerR family transcriptional regulator n=1 Tax=Ornithinimicrobium pratense TaxID=2593973 RepID=A0A5J6V4W2_9MICO|nr:MerR family transcriptional regulator [Ornithinimicrobium pratense]QFG68112.1 MerR family transcriptional regulator [Ornithinimicrobium pratense]
MRISDCADLTGTTVRTIRYYHQIGLLPTPERVGARRDYELEHVARVLRIRWLADAGLPLDSIAALIEDESAGGQDEPAPRQDLSRVEESTLHDLRATHAGLDERIAELQAQRQRVAALLQMAESGRGLRALPPGMDRFYDHLARSVTDPAALDVLRREQRLAELFAQRGLVPQEFDTLILRLREEDLSVIVDFYTRYAHLDDLAPEAAEAEIEDLVRSMTRWCKDNDGLTAEFVAALPRWAGSPQALRSLIRLTTLFAFSRRQAQVMHRLIPVMTDVLVSDPRRTKETR